MNIITQRNILLVGLPESGKTSFLAALYYSASTDIIDKSLKEYKISANSTYLNMISKKWLGCEKVERTVNVTSTSTKDVLLHLESIKFKIKFDLHIPDIAGESFLTQFVDRLWDKAYKQEVTSSTGLLLFIHPDRVKPHVLIDDTYKANKAFSCDLNEHVSDPQNCEALEINNQVDQEKIEAENYLEFNPEDCPTQIVLSDLLQNHLEQSKNNHLNVAVIVSAWETIKAREDHSPKKWVELNLPLLSQYLNCNFEQITYDVFGISAQGGDISDGTDVARLKGLNEPVDRIIVQTSQHLGKDIGLPIDWIIEQWTKEGI